MSEPSRLVNERTCAAALGLKVGWLRRDRGGKRVLPFYKIGGTIRYSLPKVREAIANMEHGGTGTDLIPAELDDLDDLDDLHHVRDAIANQHGGAVRETD